MSDKPKPDTTEAVSSTTANPTHSGGPDADDTGIRPHEVDVPDRVATDTDGPEDGVLVYAPAFHSFDVRNHTIVDTGTRIPKSRLAEARNTAERLGLRLHEA